METGRLSSDYSFRSQQSKIEKNSFLSCVYGKRAKYKYEKKGEIYWEISKIFFFFNSHVGQIFFSSCCRFRRFVPDWERRQQGAHVEKLDQETRFWAHKSVKRVRFFSS